MELRDRLTVRPDKPLTLTDWDPDETLGFEKAAAVEKTEKAIARLDELQSLMYAGHRRALLVVLQGMDGAGKDGTIRHVMRGLNPQGSRVTSFKAPSAEEADHDFLAGTHWDQYSTGSEEALTRCSTPDAPWFIVPADKKWFRNLAVSHILVETLEALDMRFPKPSFDVSPIALA